MGMMHLYSTDRFGRTGDGDVAQAALDQSVVLDDSKSYLVVSHAALGMGPTVLAPWVDSVADGAGFTLVRHSPTLTIVKRTAPGTKTVKVSLRMLPAEKMYQDDFSGSGSYASHTPEFGTRGTFVNLSGGAPTADLLAGWLNVTSATEGTSELRIDIPQMTGFDWAARAGRAVLGSAGSPGIGVGPDVFMECIAGSTTSLRLVAPGLDRTHTGLTVPAADGFFRTFRISYDGTNFRFYYHTNSTQVLIYTHAYGGYMTPAGAYAWVRTTHNSTLAAGGLDQLLFWKNGIKTA